CRRSASCPTEGMRDVKEGDDRVNGRLLLLRPSCLIPNLTHCAQVRPPIIDASLDDLRAAVKARMPLATVDEREVAVVGRGLAIQDARAADWDGDRQDRDDCVVEAIDLVVGQRSG